MALATLMLQPPELLPKFIVLDEPELGLHPAALSELAGMVRTASAKAQILMATQSTRLVDEFSPEQIVVVERDEQKHRSVFKKLDPKQLSEWLERYSLSELWEKNVLGGQP
jgi:predicted ATPase